MTGSGSSSRHHFVPVFYLQAWHNPASHLLWQYRRNPVGRIEFDQRPAKSVGFEYHLYSWQADGTPFPARQVDQLERDFFGPIDNAASEVHRKLMTSDQKSLTQEDRSVWVLFLNSLLQRMPRHVGEVQVNAAFPGTFEDDMALLWPGQDVDTLSPGMRDFFSKLNRPAMVRNTILGVMVQRILDVELLEGLLRMRWAMVDLPLGEDHFLTGDAPLILNFGRDEGLIHTLSIAVSPTRLFVMRVRGQPLQRTDLGFLAQSHSINVVRKAEKYVVSSRQLVDGRFINYRKVVEDALAKEK